MSTSTETPIPRPGILDIAAYVPGKSSAPSGVKLHKLSSNETPLGPSPASVEAYRQAGEHLELYPDGSAARLREAIGAHYGLNPDHIVCGAGSDELLSLLAQGYLGPGDEAIHTRHGFLVYNIAIKTNGATPVVAAERTLTADTDEILNCLSDRTKLVFLANPNNPTGTYMPFSEVRRLHAGLPRGALLVIDAAYAEYVRKNDYEAGIELVATSQNVVMTRTFSKLYGLAALRLGWLYGPPHVVDVLNRIRGPFNVNAPAIEAGIAALADTKFTDKAVVHNEEWLQWLRNELTSLGLEIPPSVGNFVLIQFPDKDGQRAPNADAFLTARGLILRRMENYHLPNALRMSVGSEQANRAVVEALRTFLGKAS